MRAAEQALIDAGDTVESLMDRAGRGAAQWVWRIAAHRRITVLCGPGNNGGDGYVIAEALRARGGKVCVIAPLPPRTDAAIAARAAYRGAILDDPGPVQGDLWVDCLFGSGLARPLTDAHCTLLAGLAAHHRQSIAIDVPSGIDADSGLPLNPGLPGHDLTLALGAWKPAHFLMPASAAMGALRLVDIGIAAVPGAAQVIGRPALAPPPADAHKYRRGLLGVIGGEMPGAARLAAMAAQGAGAGYVKLLGTAGGALADDIVCDAAPLADALTDRRLSALLVGPGLGRHAEARERLAMALASPAGVVIDADGLMLLSPRLLSERRAPTVATPHEGELAALERAFGCQGTGSKADRASALAAASGMVIVAKGADTVVAAPGRRLAFAPRASSWLSTAGTGDVLAGAVASRLACGVPAFDAACAGVWLHGAAARLCLAPFSASTLAAAIARAYAACL